MQELLGRIARLDPTASLGLRVIACFDELVVGNVNTRALLSAAASLAGCTAGFRHDPSARSERITPRGQNAPVPSHPSAAPTDAGTSDNPWPTASADGLTVWLERAGPGLPNDAIILERLALAVRIRHGRGRTGADNRRDLGLLVDSAVPLEQRTTAAGALGLTSGRRYRVLAAPLFAVWREHPSGPEDVVPTVHGPIHVLIVPEHATTVVASPVGVGTAAVITELHHSFRTALVSLRLCEPPAVGVVHADDYGSLIELLAQLPEDAPHSDAEGLAELADHPWGRATIDAVVRSQSVRQAARAAGVHHSTMQSRVDTIIKTLGYDPFEGFGKSRLGMAYLFWRLCHSRVLDLPAPAVSSGSASLA
ncbi:CdaR family transcriptional regulator [Phycicoccus sp. Root563]|uniref:hypothetical protein n=1 Tax=Phycicoccus sp. Root563 TaxID=1736562 RepID=UPI0007033609|nr:hypothetical protein [Phycicoccus sp. Root563]KQZ88395.1 CdaR family transcriptional regulator [Phycicoccus sp. Root563]